jgi:hypothetical protein
VLPNASLLRRALTALDLTGVALAQHLSEMRDDDKETGQATISRWLKGVSPVDPAVLCWLRELLRNRVRTQGHARIKWGEKKSLLVCVGNTKGGVGTTCIAAALAIVASRDFKEAVRHIQIGYETDLVTQKLSSLGISSEYATWSELERCIPRKREIVIVDMHRGNVGAAQLALTVSRLPYDVLLVPADFGSIDGDVTKDFFECLPDKSKIALLHYPKHLVNLEFFKHAQELGFDISESYFVPFAFPRSHEELFAWNSREVWSNEDQHHLFWYLFEDLLDRAGIEYQELNPSGEGVEALSLEELLRAVGH